MCQPSCQLRKQNENKNKSNSNFEKKMENNGSPQLPSISSETDPMNKSFENKPTNNQNDTNTEISYKDFRWRMDVEVSKRNLHDIEEPEPTFLCQIQLSNDSNTTFSAKYMDLKHCVDTLKEALKEHGTRHIRRTKHYIK